MSWTRNDRLAATADVDIRTLDDLLHALRQGSFSRLVVAGTEAGLETATDKCEDAANVMESFLIKHA